LLANQKDEQLVNSLTPTVVTWVQLVHHVPDRVKPSFVVFDIRAL